MIRTCAMEYDKPIHTQAIGPRFEGSHRTPQKVCLDLRHHVVVAFAFARRPWVGGFGHLLPADNGGSRDERVNSSSMHAELNAVNVGPKASAQVTQSLLN